MTDSLDFRFLETSNDFRQLEPFAASIWEQHYTPIIGADQVAFMLNKYQSAQAMFDQFSAGYKYAVVISGGQKAGYFAYDGKAEKDVLSDPSIQKFLDKYDGNIKDGSIKPVN